MAEPVTDTVHFYASGWKYAKCALCSGEIANEFCAVIDRGAAKPGLAYQFVCGRCVSRLTLDAVDVKAPYVPKGQRRRRDGGAE